MYCLNMLRISQELAVNVDPLYEDIANKFFEHFLYIAHAMNGMGGEGLWHEEDGFFYDRLSLPDGQTIPMRVRSMVGVIPLFAVDTMESGLIESLPGFEKRMNWFIANRPDLCQNLAPLMRHGVEQRHLLSLVSRGRLVACSKSCWMRTSSSRRTASVRFRNITRPILTRCKWTGNEYRVDYEPAESSTGLFGGNSNWRGPVWFPVNYLLIESLQRFHYYFGDEFTVEFPTGSGVQHAPGRGGGAAFAASVAAVPARRSGPAAGIRRNRKIPDRPALSRLSSVLRIFPRRQRRGPGRQPSDRLDRAGR